MWSYSSNWMGPINQQFIEEHGSGWSGGRIDCYYSGNDLNELEYTYNARTEIGAPIMTNRSWNIMSNFLDTLETEKLLTFDDIRYKIRECCNFNLELFPEDKTT
jgi:hypothetical protein